MSLIGPNSRSNFDKSLTFVDSRDPRLDNCVSNVLQRQKAVEFSGVSASSTPNETPETPTLLEALDRAQVPFSTSELYKKYAYSLRQPQVIRSVCEWAVTSLRAGAYRAYLVAMLLKKAYHDGVNIQDPIMEFLGNFTLPRTVTSREDVYLLISELVRCRVFNVGKYMTWVIARGSLSNLETLEVDSPCEARLLAELPIHAAHQRIKNLRTILLSNSGYSCEKEDQFIAQTKDFVFRRGVFAGPGMEVQGLSSEELTQLRGLSRTVKSDVGLWLSNCMREHLARVHQGKGQWSEITAESLKSMNLSQLMFIRELLEAFGDMAILAEVCTPLSPFPKPN